MSTDPWRAWLAWAARLATPSPAPAAPGAGAILDSAQRFAAAAGKYFEAARSSPASAAQAAQSFADFLRDEFAALFTPPPVLGAAPGWGAGAASFGANLGETPALGLGREHVERARRAAATWQRLDEAQRRLQRLWLDALREAAAAFARRLGVMPQPATDLEAPQRLYDAWIDCAEEAYAQAAHSQAFADALADCVNTGSEWRRETQAGIEAWAKLWDLPTRSELNSLAERLRAMEEAMQAQNAAPRPARKPRGPRRKGSP